MSRQAPKRRPTSKSASLACEPGDLGRPSGTKCPRTTVFLSVSLIINFTMLTLVANAAAPSTTEPWGIFELTLDGPTNGNPFLDVRLSARFYQDDNVTEATGLRRRRDLPHSLYARSSRPVALQHPQQRSRTGWQ